jgi:broad specificity phosphatase PhoE
MNKPTTIYIVRHGESEFNKQAILAGHADTVLTPEGIEQALATKEELSHIHFDVVYSSDLKRALKTAELIRGMPVPHKNRLPDLRERNYGEVEGQPAATLDASEAVKYSLPHEQKWTFKNSPGMESDRELSNRFMQALKEVAVTNQGKTVLVVAHGGPIRTTLMELEDLTHDDLPRSSIKNGGYIKLAYDKNGFKVIQISGVKL